jgi:hypothetical protein
MSTMFGELGSGSVPVTLLGVIGGGAGVGSAAYAADIVPTSSVVTRVKLRSVCFDIGRSPFRRCFALCGD